MALPVSAAEIRAKQGTLPGVDPNVKIPRQILEAGKRSEDIQRQITGEAEPSVAAEIVAKADGQPSDGAPVTPPSDAPLTADAPVPPAEQPATPPPTTAPPEDENWERRFKSLQGRYDTDVRRVREQMAQVTERLERLSQENIALRAPQMHEQPPAPNGHAAPLTEQEIADYGPEFVDVMQRIVSNATGPLNQEIQNLRGQLGHVQAETGNAFLNRMNLTLDQLSPGWQDLNRDPKFIAWSQLPDVFSGAIRKELMQGAWNSGEPNRLAAFFRAYLAEEAATAPQRAAEPTGASPPRTMITDVPVNPSSLAPGTPVDLSALAAPGRAHSAGGQPAEKPVYTSAEITRFYTDVAAGRWRGREAQQRAIDNDIMMAQREGRIIVDQRTQLPKDPYTR